MNAYRNQRRPHGISATAVLTAGALAVLTAAPAMAGQLIYTPVNPSFGGNPLNGSYLLSKAQAEKSYPLPLDDLNLPASTTSVLAQTDKYVMYQRNNHLYLLDTTSGTVKQLPDDTQLPSTGSPQ
ncbi:hypothetical protein CDEF62S_05979 [Castellaniella defragrans]